MATKPPTSCPILSNLVQSCPIEMTNVMLKNRPHLCNLKSIALVQVLAKKKSSCNLGVTLHSMSPMSPADSMFKFLDVQRPNPSCHTVQNCTSFFSILAPENFYREKTWESMRISVKCGYPSWVLAMIRTISGQLVLRWHTCPMVKESSKKGYKRVPSWQRRWFHTGSK